MEAEGEIDKGNIRSKSNATYKKFYQNFLSGVKTATDFICNTTKKALTVIPLGVVTIGPFVLGEAIFRE